VERSGTPDATEEDSVKVKELQLLNVDMTSGSAHLVGVAIVIDDNDTNHSALYALQWDKNSFKIVKAQEDPQLQ
jgi:hypothetical protein